MGIECKILQSCIVGSWEYSLRQPKENRSNSWPEGADPPWVPGLYIIQYISSLLDWKSGQIVLNQTVDQVNSWDPYLRVTLTFSFLQRRGQANHLP
ncbi:unnamed protein product [Prunus brigantina]